MATVTVNLGSLPQGRKVEVPGLGVFENGGGATQVDDRVWQRYQLNNPNYDGDGSFVISDAEAKKRSKVLATASETDDLSTMKKDDLVALAKARGLEAEGKTKDDLVKELNDAT